MVTNISSGGRADFVGLRHAFLLFITLYARLVSTGDVNGEICRQKLATYLSTGDVAGFQTALFCVQ